MNKNIYLIMSLLLITNLEAGSGCGWGAFGGAFAGSWLGNAMSQPRQVVVQQPVQTVQREVYVQQPVYQNRHPKKIVKQNRPSDEAVRMEEAKARQAEAAAERERAQAERVKAELELERLRNNEEKKA